MHPECFDEKTKETFAGKRPFGFQKLKYITETEESKALNDYEKPCIIISASGMCEAGRIRHHLRNNIEDPKNTILVVGYMAENTLGRKIVEKEPEIKIFDRFYKLRAQVSIINAFSAHADKDDLYEYIKNMPSLKKVFLVHGEYEGQKVLKTKLEENFDFEVLIPDRGQEVEL